MNPAKAEIEKGEQLSRQLSSGQLGMIAIGGAIGTGLFLGSSLAVRIAGPGVIVSYLIGAALALLFMSALSEMAVAHPTAGSFGVYAELYLNPWAGFRSAIPTGPRNVLRSVVKRLPSRSTVSGGSPILRNGCGFSRSRPPSFTSTPAASGASAALNIGSQ